MITVTCNGCFQTIHPGHLFYLGFARGQGDELVVGINSDSYIRSKKGYVPVPALARATALMSLDFIRDVVVFNEPDPREFIRMIKPNVHCTGAEYSNGTCVEEDLCREMGIKLVYIPRIGNWSTRAILNGEVTYAGDVKGKSATQG